MIYRFSPTGNTTGATELVFDEGPNKGVKWIYGGMKFADEPAEDGSIAMTFDYEVTGEYKPLNREEFERDIGDTLVSILESQIEKGDVVYANGTDEPVTNT